MARAKDVTQRRQQRMHYREASNRRNNERKDDSANGETQRKTASKRRKRTRDKAKDKQSSTARGGGREREQTSAGSLAEVAEAHGLDGDGGAEEACDAVDLAVRVRARRVPRVEHRLATHTRNASHRSAADTRTTHSVDQPRHTQQNIETARREERSSAKHQVRCAKGSIE